MLCCCTPELIGTAAFSEPTRHIKLKDAGFLPLLDKTQDALFTKSTTVVVWQQKSLKAFQFSWELSFYWQQESHLNNAAFQENVQAVHSRTALHYNATDFHWGGETYRIQLLKKRTPAGFLVGIRMSEEKKTGCRWTNNWHLSGICCTFHRFFLSSWCHLKKLVIRQCALYLRLLIEAWDLTEDLLKKGTF